MIRTARYLMALVAIGSLMIAAPALAHDSWLEASPVLIETGQPVTIQMFLGNHSNQHRSYRLAGKWTTQYTKVSLISPRGEEKEITGQFVDFGEDEEKVPPKGAKGYYMAQLTPLEEGLYLVVAREERVLQHGDGPKFRSVKIGKTAFAAVGTPTVASAKRLGGFNRPVAGASGMEIIPMNNPLGLARGDSITLEVRYKGKPLSTKEVSLIRKVEGAPSVVDLKTDDSGRVTFNVWNADSFLARIKVDEESEKAEGKYEKSTYEATFTFPVFNRSTAAAAR